MSLAFYGFRRSLMGHEVRYELSDGALTSSAGLQLALGDIAKIQVFNAIGAGGLCVIRPRAGPKVVLASRHFQGFGRFEDRSEAFDTFVRALIAAVAKVHPSPVLLSGQPWWLWWTWAILVVASSFIWPLMFGLFAMSLIGDGTAQAVIVAAGVIVGMATSLIGGLLWLWRQRQKRFEPSAWD